MFKRLKEKFSRRPSPNEASSSEPEKLGLIPLVPRTEPTAATDRTGTRHYPVDIVAIHGLNGDAHTTWTHPDNGALWLRDFLPATLPGCRVFTYGYPADVFSQSVAKVQEFARRLLIEIRDLQAESSNAIHPVIFVCHSLGGVVFKQALVIAHQDDHQYRQVLESCIGVAFLGTPHRGSKTANFAGVLGMIANTLSTAATVGLRGKVARTDLLDHIKSDSTQLQELSSQARYRLQNLAVVSFFETLPTPPLSSLVVDQTSATLNLPNEEIVPLYEDHLNICRFSKESTNYSLVINALRRIAAQAALEGPSPEVVSTDSSRRSLSELERACVGLFNYGDEGDPLDNAELFSTMKPTPGTCQWIRTHDAFVSWLRKDSNALIWLTGHSGCGKTTLCLSLSQHLGEVFAGQKANSVLTYLCGAANSRQSTANMVLASLIFQIISRRRSMISHVRRVYELQGASILKSFSSLWGILLRILSDEKMESCLIILDAIDECETFSCKQLLDYISKFLVDSSSPPSKQTCVKFLITSRPLFHESVACPYEALQDRVRIDENQVGYSADLQLFISRRLEEISARQGYSEEVKGYLLAALRARADQTFLWSHMILSSIERSPLTSLRHFERIIASIPDQLATTYEQYLSTIPAEHQAYAARLLGLIIASPRPLHLEELNIAVTIDDSHRTTADVARDGQTAVSYTVQSILGPLVRVSGSFVTPIHLSLREYLLGHAGTLRGTSVQYGTSDQGCALQMFAACVQYLLLQDFKVDLFDAGQMGHMAAEENDTKDQSPQGSSPDSEDYALGLDDLFADADAQDIQICHIISSQYAFYSYASLHWALHAARCDALASEELQTRIRLLLVPGDQGCQGWLRFYCAMSGEDGIETLLDAHPVILAAYFDLHITLKQLLGEHGTPTGITTPALYWGSRRGHERVVKSLMAAGAEPNHAAINNQTALCAASEHGSTSCVAALLAHERTDINARGRHGKTALSFACANGHSDIVRCILDRRDSLPDQADSSGSTPFICAVSGGHLDIAESLMTLRNVDVNHRDKTGRTALSWAAGEGTADTVRRIIRFPGIDCNLQDTMGRTPLSWAAGNGAADVINILLRHAPVNSQLLDRDKRSAVSWASGGGHDSALNTLLRFTAWDTNAEDIDGWVPLAWAIQKDRPRVIETLLFRGGALLERRDRSGRTALSWAVEYGHLGVVRVLLEAGADPNTQSYTGRTPFSIAKDFSRKDMLDELERYQR